MWGFFLITVLFEYGDSKLWPKGIVHYAINTKDYDIHSQDEIISTLQRIEGEICIKFFNTPLNYSASEDNQILYISNPDKRKTCPPDVYSFNKSIVDMTIGYKCLSRKNISRIVVDMLRASIQPPVDLVSSFDLMRKYQDLEDDPNQPTLLSPIDRNYINGHYHNECGDLAKPVIPETRRFTAGHVNMTEDNMAYYKEKLWPLGIVMYGVQAGLKGTQEHSILKNSMTTIELMSCIVFQEAEDQGMLEPRSLLWFAAEGEDTPPLGRVEGNQTISLRSMVEGAPGHRAHTLNLLLRALGIPMMSNRYDRDSYVQVHWKNIKKGKEHLMEKTPMAAWIASEDVRLPYDFESATHAPANFVCSDTCGLQDLTILPIQDHLWQKTMTMGHRPVLSEGDLRTLITLYGELCRARYATTH